MPDVREILAKTMRVKYDDLTGETTMDQLDTWDSLTHMELVANLESALNLEFTGDEIAEMISVAAIERLVQARKR
ncbi:hypothetical protein FACS189460_4380 [Deltaproteobacteria bacterium]|nr:hypothetical protein FACS189460_4380 [Deltaproteobacteria bacterium]